MTVKDKLYSFYNSLKVGDVYKRKDNNKKVKLTSYTELNSHNWECFIQVIDLGCSMQRKISIFNLMENYVKIQNDIDE
jgi:hypothetical protein